MLWSVHGSGACGSGGVCSSDSICVSKSGASTDGKMRTPCPSSNDEVDTSHSYSKGTLTGKEGTCTTGAGVMEGATSKNTGEGDDEGHASDSGSVVFVTVDVAEDVEQEETLAEGRGLNLKAATVHGSPYNRYQRRRPLRWILLIVWTWLCVTLAWAIVGTIW